MRWMGAFPAWADSTMRTMRASVVSAPTASVLTVNAPSALMEPPVTLSPTSCCSEAKKLCRFSEGIRSQYFEGSQSPAAAVLEEV